MPKIVDHDKQRLLVAEAAWRVIRRDGMEQASVRNIALEAGISAGSMRHYFSTQSELLLYAMNLVSERVSNRITQMSFDASPLENMKLLLLELLPSTDEKRAEMEVWYAFTAKSKNEPVLKVHADKVYDELRHAMATVITYLMELNLSRTDLDKELEIERLYALVDGLGIHAILRPDQMNTKIMENILTTHLATLCRDAE
ncbi:TetR/AcrR family transcriptional regulator [Paenibacillus taichungensis]|uniref:TetR family transcriptional regulator n=2 Tax=Paenibacillus taichungensis TaxID=484184 RepID=A0ABX2MPX6_9BACL|nr:MULTISPECIES: TetR/AcrR family transcriptional regulator [Paenibacillus]MDR9749608.1 TetR/AcrR family transcriptional regulator [Paenibacillus taichungensis]MEC0108879.1 TetR/AcrR family transcriptional regulator [Paenibacillus taichungensis]MEC0195422.1 TetR/AcrR family transcriptional regulator [Paenibacillus taichungensis]NUU56108.1 TetR family transcriptional regulator [Paenibacillus taichungensis]PIH55742.1 TetR family transcriptional regulator [Paenibacillus sp. LK1]